MNKKEFIESAARTWNNQGRERNIRHALLGMRSDLGELEDAIKKVVGYGRPEVDRVNVLEELGDLFYFTVQLWREFSSPAGILPPLDIPIAAIRPVVTVAAPILEDDEETIEEFTSTLFGRILDLSSLLYRGIRLGNLDRAAFAVNVARHCSIIAADLDSLLAWIGFTREQCFDKNHAKRAARYPEKFDGFREANRDLAAERVALEAAGASIDEHQDGNDLANGDVSVETIGELDEFPIVATTGDLSGFNGMFTGRKTAGGYIGRIALH
jgi:NTP pyrophosphatase (non-canonical NTP hydrolase)